MLDTGFVPRHRAHWERLSELLDRAEGEGLEKLAPGELQELMRLYRTVTAHLAEARTTHQPLETVRYLNQLTSRAYTRIYAGSRRRHLRLGYLFAVEVPRTFRRRGRYIAVSVLLSALAAATAFVAVRYDARWGAALTSAASEQAWRAFSESQRPAGAYFADTARTLGGPEFAGLLMSNNIQVALRAYALGVTLGLGTVYVLLVNGAMVGVFLAVGAAHGKLPLFLAIVAPHGVAELSAVFVAGGAGLMLGAALVDPGDLPRREALRRAAVESVRLVMGTVPLFIVAGITEAFISPQQAGLFAENTPRILFGLLAGGVCWLYLLFGDRIWGEGVRDGKSLDGEAEP
jgi:uncharacterized membrane protein SpoIIM required for sporulation